MRVHEAMRRLGGVAKAGDLVRLTSRRKVRTALKRREIVREARGRYALPTAHEARRAAHRLSAVVTGRSAATAHGLPMKTQPALPEVTVPRNRKVARERREGVDVRWRDIPPVDVRNGVLRVGPAVIDCARTLPFDEALAIADSALRAGLVVGGPWSGWPRPSPAPGEPRRCGWFGPRAANPRTRSSRSCARSLWTCRGWTCSLTC